jgi:two-component system, OmpR family, flagellar system response regulator FtcR
MIQRRHWSPTMIVLIENRPNIAKAISAGFDREGVPCFVLTGEAAQEWLACLAESERSTLDGVVIGGSVLSEVELRALRATLDVPIVALSDRRSLDETLGLFRLGVDDVISKPVHPLEVMARLKIARRRVKAVLLDPIASEIIVFSDGRDPIIGGSALMLPRRERRIMSCLFDARGGWVMKSTLFNQVYGLFNDGISESVVESHVSRLRRRLRERLGHDAIETQRFLGYRLVQRPVVGARTKQNVSHEQDDQFKLVAAAG